MCTGLYKIIQSYRITWAEVSFWLLAFLLVFTTTYSGLWLIPLAYTFMKREKYAELTLTLLILLILANNEHRPLAFINEWRIWYISGLLIFFIFFSKKLVLFPKRNLRGAVGDLLKSKWLASSKRWLGFAPFFILAILSTIFSDYANYGIPRLCSYFILLWLMPQVFRQAFDQNREVLFQKIFVGVGTLLLIGYLWQFFDSSFTHLISQYQGIKRPPRFHGVFGNPNGLGIFCMLFFIWTFCIWQIRPQTLPNYLWFLLFGFLIFNLLLSRSRTETAALLVFVFTWKFPKNSLAVVIACVICLFFFRYEFFLLVGEASELLGITDWVRPETLQIGGGRFIAYELGWSFIGESFWFGNGWGYTSSLFGQYAPYLIAQAHQGNAHQSFLTVWLDLGLVGLVTFILGWGVFVQSAIRKQKRLALAVIVAVLVSANLESWLIASLNPFSILLVLIVSTLADVAE